MTRPDKIGDTKETTELPPSPNSHLDSSIDADTPAIVGVAHASTGFPVINNEDQFPAQQKNSVGVLEEKKNQEPPHHQLQTGLQLRW